MGTSNISVIGRQHLKNWDGVSSQRFSSRSPTGGNLALNTIGYEIDILTVFGSGDEYTDATLSKAIGQIGSTNKRCIVLNPGTWAINNDVTVTSNITLKCPAGVTVSVASGKTLTVEGPLEAGPYQIFSGSGTVSITGVQIIHDQWADGSGDAYLPSTDNEIDLGSEDYTFKNGYFSGTVEAGILVGEIRNMKIYDSNDQQVHEFPVQNLGSADMGFI